MNYYLSILRSIILFAFLFTSSYWINAQNFVQIGTGTQTNTSTLYAPLYRFSGTSTTSTIRSNIVFTAAELQAQGVAPGSVISKLAFNKTSTGTNGTSTINYKVYMANSSSLPPLATSTLWSAILASHTLVFEDTNFQVPNNPGWMEIPLIQPFVYTGGSLEVGFDARYSSPPNTTNNFSWEYTNGFADNIIASVSTAADPSLNSTVSTYKHRPNTRFFLLPTATNDIGVASIDSIVPFCGASTQNVFATISNFGINQVSTASITLENNGTIITTVPLSSVLDTLGGSGSISAVVNFGSVNLINGQNNLKAYTSLPNGFADTVNLNDTAFFSISSSLSGTYTVGSGSGFDFQSLLEAVNSLNLVGVCGPVTINLDSASGPYLGRVIINEITGADAVNRISINGNGAVVNGNSTVSAERSSVVLDGADYITLNNLNITVVGPTTGTGILLTNDAQYNEILGCTIDLGTITSTSSLNSGGIVASNSLTSNTSGGRNCNFTRIEGNIIKGSAIGGPYYGIVLNGNSPGLDCDSNRIENNQLIDFYNNGIRLINTSNTLVKGNILTRPTVPTTTCEAIYLTGTSNPGVIIDGNSIFNLYGSNTSSTSTFYGLDIASDGTVSNPIRAYNNLIYNVNSNGTQYGVNLSGAEFAEFYHNTISLDNQLSTAGTTRGIFITSTTTENVKFRNNIVSITRKGSGTKHPFYAAGSSVITGLELNNNGYFLDTDGGSNNGIAFIATENYTTLTDFTDSTGFDSASVVADPLFENPAIGNLRPAAASLNNIGADLTSIVAEDITGVARPPLSDPGAYEFTPVANDAGVLSILAPLSPCLNATENVVVEVRNFGLSPITSLTVGFEVNGVFAGSNSFTLNLGSSEVDTLTIGSFTFTSSGPFTLKTYTSLPNGGADGNTSNDSLEIARTGTAIPAGTYTIGGVSPDYATVADAALALSTNGVCGGNLIFNIRPGTYSGKVVLSNIAGTSFANTVTFQSENGDSTSVIITDSAGTTSVDNYAILVENTSHISFRNLTLERTGTNQTNATIVALNNVNSVSFENSVFLGITGLTGTNGSGSNSCIFSNGNASEDSLRVVNNRFGGASNAIWVFGSSSDLASGSLVENNTMENIYLGIFMDNAEGLIIRNNRISRLGTGTIQYFGISLRDITSFLVEKNTVLNDNQGYGLRLVTCIDGIVVNNFLTSSGSGTSISYPISLETDCQQVDVVYNTAVTNSTATTNGRSINVAGTSTSGINIINNNMVNYGGGYAYYVASNATSGIDSSHYNNLFSTAATNPYFWGANVSDLTALQTASGRNFNSVSGDPLFSVVGNPTPSSATCNDNGLALTTITTQDIFANPRSATTPDIGAVEYTPAADDAAIVGIIGIENRICTGASIDVSIVVTNFGTNTITLLPNSVTLTGSSVIPLNNSASVNIASNTTDTVFVGSFTPIDTGTFQIIATVSLLGDNNSANDTLLSSVDFILTQPTPVILTPAQTVCAGSSVFLAASGTQNIAWFSDSNLSTQVAEGDSVLVGPISNNSTFYVTNDIGTTTAVGLANNVGTTSFITSTIGWGLNFNVTTAVNIDHVHVYPTGTGTIQIQILTPGNTVLFSGPTVNVSGSGASTKVQVPVNLSLAPGSYKMGMTFTGITNLIRESSGSSYPYTSPNGEVSIVSGATGTGTSTAAYYWFYDWQVSTSSGCPGIDSTIVTTSNVPPTPDFAFSVNEDTATFINTTNGGASYSWNFGDGVGTSTAVNPTYVYTTSGVFTVTLNATNACGGPIPTSKNVAIILGLEDDLSENSALEAFPIPVQDLLSVRLPKRSTQGMLILTDPRGVKIKTQEVSAHLEQIDWSLEYLPKGLYFLQWQSGDQLILKKIVLE